MSTDMINDKVINVLWVENDSFHIDSLLWWIEQDPKYQLEITSSLFEATETLNSVPSDRYGLIILDLIMSTKDEQGRVPLWLHNDERLGANGIPFLKYLREELRIKCPVLLLSIVNNPIEQYNLHVYNPVFYLEKRSLRPTVVKEVVEQIISSSRKTT